MYCQSCEHRHITHDKWQGVNLVYIPQQGDGAFSTISFDFKSVLHASKTKDLVLTLGYNTAMFNILFRLKKIKNIINMDGIEWKRKK